MLGCGLIVFLLEAIWFECSYRCVQNDESKKAAHNKNRNVVTKAWDDIAFKVNHQKDPKRLHKNIIRNIYCCLYLSFLPLSNIKSRSGIL